MAIIVIITPAALPLVVLAGPADSLWSERVDIDRGEVAEGLAVGEAEGPLAAGRPTAGAGLGRL